MTPDKRTLYGMAVLVGNAVGTFIMTCVGLFQTPWYNVQLGSLLPGLMLLAASFS